MLLDSNDFSFISNRFFVSLIFFYKGNFDFIDDIRFLLMRYIYIYIYIYKILSQVHAAHFLFVIKNRAKLINIYKKNDFIQVSRN